MNTRTTLKCIVFMQFFIWGSWITTLGAYMVHKLHFTGIQVGSVYSTIGIASLIMPNILGVIADRWIPANRLYILCHAVGATMLFLAASETTPYGMFIIMLINCLAFMPTIPMTNAISYAFLEQEKHDIVTQFPLIRIYGTLGFICAAWLVSLLRLELSAAQLYISSGASVVLCVIALFLPKVPVHRRENKAQRRLISTLGLDSFALLKQPKMAIFFIFSMFLGTLLQITSTFGGPFLHDFALVPEFESTLVVQFPAILLSISQISEVIFILFVPFFLKRFGIKYVMLISMGAWVLRFTLFAYGDPTPWGTGLLVLSMVVYGVAFDFYNISSSIYIEKSVSPSNRNAAQGLFMVTSNGVGAYVGAMGSGWIVDTFTQNGVKDWPLIWLIFAAYSLAMLIIFFFVFKDSK